MPECFGSDTMCLFCNLDFNSNDKLREHVNMNHKDHVKKGWSDDAMAKILMCDEYIHWLESPYASRGICESITERKYNGN